MTRAIGARAALLAYGVKLADIATPLKEHQQRVVDKLQQPDQPGLVAAHGLGSGKTLTSIAAAEALGLPADVVLPAALRANYIKELEKHAPVDAPETHIQSLENVARKQVPLRHPFLIVDEAHRGRNPSKTQQALRNTSAKKRLLLTGSPFYNQPSDIAAPVNIAAGASVLPSDPDEFRRRYVAERELQPSLIGKMLGGTPHMEYGVNPEQREYLQTVLKKYVDYHPGSTENFPTREDQTIGVPMSSRQKEIYDTLIGKAPEWVRERVRTGLPPKKSELGQLNRFLQGTRQVSLSTAPYHLDRPAEHPKIQKAVNELNELLSQNPRAKALVYSAYLDAGINPYKAELDKLQIPYGEFTGAMPKAKRDQMVRDYNANKLRALLLSRAGGEGLDLKGTRLIQLLEPHWNEEALKQVIGRGIRYKSHDALPEEERRVQVQRYVTQNPRRGIAERLHLKDPERSVDQYLLGLAQQKEELNQKFRDLLVEPPMSKTSTYTDGQKEALSQYGVAQPPDNDPGSYYEKKKKKSWLPAAVAGGLGALGAYKLMRRPSFSTNPGVRKLQERSQKGFHRVVDVSPRADDGLDHGIMGRLWNKTLPQVNAKGELDRLNRFKLWAHEGSEAIPVAQHPVTGKSYIPGAPDGVDVNGWVYGRSTGSMAGVRKNPIRGGHDLEGDLRTQNATTDLALAGKGREADILAQHAPGSVLPSATNLRPFVPQTRGTPTPAQARAFQKAVAKHYASQGIDNYAIKTTHGLTSGGEFPRAEHDWGKVLEQYNTHMAKPENLTAYRRARAEGENAAIDYLRANEIHEGHVLRTALKNPRRAMAQQWADEPLHEYRVHSHQGVVDPRLVSSRMTSHTPLKLRMEGVSPDAAAQFAQHTLDQLPPHLRKGTFGMDVMPIRNPDGTISYKMVEMNPAERGSATNAGGSSGFLDSDTIPGAGWKHYRAMTGKHTEPAALLGATAAGTGAAGLARWLTPEQEDDTPHPVG